MKPRNLYAHGDGEPFDLPPAMINVAFNSIIGVMCGFGNGIWIDITSGFIQCFQWLLNITILISQNSLQTVPKINAQHPVLYWKFTTLSFRWSSVFNVFLSVHRAFNTTMSVKSIFANAAFNVGFAMMKRPWKTNNPMIKISPIICYIRRY